MMTPRFRTSRHLPVTLSEKFAQTEGGIALHGIARPLREINDKPELVQFVDGMGFSLSMR